MGIFEPFRPIGYTTTSVPFSVQRPSALKPSSPSASAKPSKFTIAQSSLWSSSVRNCRRRFGLLLRTWTTVYTFAAYGTDIAVFKRSHQVATWSIS
ncbi:hypothetical protein RchiOBHm_Chr4g0397371 [Rosa chinensis]|uniref:Uncharacterized protein n=1 Tax=Rosa chinensis TaxID=74649 RepID=A0A2P6QS30_ROSCH|nr:hypothetical protein RchiOBHm_Chr4g0397371 [Rosa chinensis]